MDRDAMDRDAIDHDAQQILYNEGYEGVKILSNYSYDSALIGVTYDNRAVYDYDLMVEWLMAKEGFSGNEAIEWIEYNTIRALQYMGPDGPIVMFSVTE